MRKIILLTVLLSFSSCGFFETRAVLKKFMDDEIVISNDLEYFFEGRDTTSSVLSDLNSKLIVYLDPNGCSTCEVSNIYDWYEVIKYNEWTRGKFGVVFIFSPNSESYEEVKRAIKYNVTDNAIVLLDKNGSFTKLNPNIPGNRNYHVFMVDKDNNVILAGNPLVNEKMWDLYKKEIAKLSK